MRGSSSLAQRLREQLAQIPSVEICDIGQHRCGIVSFNAHAIDAREIQRRLNAVRINVSVSPAQYTLLDMRSRRLENVVRASVHYYNTEAEVDRCCARAGEDRPLVDSTSRGEPFHPGLDLQGVGKRRARGNLLLAPDHAAEAAQLFGQHAGCAAAAGADLQRQRPRRLSVPDFDRPRIGTDPRRPAVSKDLHPVEAAGGHARGRQIRRRERRHRPAIPLQLGQGQIDLALRRAMKLRAEAARLRPPQQGLRGVEIVHHRREQRVLAGKLLHDMSPADAARSR